MCRKSITYFVKKFSSVGYTIFYFNSLFIFLLYKTTVATAHCIFVSSLSTTDDIAVQQSLKSRVLFLHVRLCLSFDLRTIEEIDEMEKKDETVSLSSF